MQAALDLTFRGMAPSPYVEAAVSSWMERLGHVYDRIQHCRVWIDVPHHHRRRGVDFQVKIVVAIPGSEIVTHDTGDDVYLAVACAFLAARRQLQDHARIERGDVKHHATGRVGSWVERRAVVGAARGTPGVHHVDDQLQVA